MHEPLETSEVEDVPTITTVARLANVSVASASRVLNGIRTSPATLERVTAAAESVGYVPNAAARSLRSRRTGQIAFAMPDVGNPVYTAMVASIQEVARVAGVRLLLHSTGADSDDELAMIRDLRHRYVDGLILACLHVTEEHAAELSVSAAPVVVIGRPTAGTPVDTVRAYSRKGAAEAVRHLHAAGRTRIAFVNGPTHTVSGLVAAARLPRRAALVRAAAGRAADRGRERLHGRARAQRGRARCSRASGPTRSSAPTTCSRSASSLRCATHASTFPSRSRSSAWTTATSRR